MYDESFEESDIVSNIKEFDTCVTKCLKGT